ncbi:unnamed protein product [Haemonchus placei]|uniref:Lipoprotein n=1 Tax=Haemonchus placei TaxID=6290 RepID=A0A0N4WKU2_HAEPC|nr:unnamed protein product [Haemonchus placei]
MTLFPKEWSDEWAEKALEYLKSPDSVKADMVIKGKQPVPAQVLPKGRITDGETARDGFITTEGGGDPVSAALLVSTKSHDSYLI